MWVVFYTKCVIVELYSVSLVTLVKMTMSKSILINTLFLTLNSIFFVMKYKWAFTQATCIFSVFVGCVLLVFWLSVFCRDSLLTNRELVHHMFFSVLNCNFKIKWIKWWSHIFIIILQGMFLLNKWVIHISIMLSIEKRLLFVVTNRSIFLKYEFSEHRIIQKNKFSLDS